MRKPYTRSIEVLMELHYSRLSEKDKRHYVALEVVKLGHGGQIYIQELLKVSQKTIEKGIRELNDPGYYSQIPEGKQRRKGGGRKKNLEK
jgi:predicted HTH transcriptional regulator